ncbi:MAG: hypothetical protein AAF411_13800 [Myxococcota bacterium]
MGKFLFFFGVACTVVAAATGLIGLDVNAAGRSEVNPLASLALAVAAIAAFQGSKVIEWGAPKE